MTQVADTAFSGPDQPTLALGDSPTWNMALVVCLPDGYSVHPTGLEHLRDLLRDRFALVSTPGGRELDILCSAFGPTHECAEKDAESLRDAVLRVVGLEQATVVELSVWPLEPAHQIIERLAPGPEATVHQLTVRDRAR